MTGQSNKDKACDEPITMEIVLMLTTRRKVRPDGITTSTRNCSSVSLPSAVRCCQLHRLSKANELRSQGCRRKTNANTRCSSTNGEKIGGSPCCYYNWIT